MSAAEDEHRRLRAEVAELRDRIAQMESAETRRREAASDSSAERERTERALSQILATSEALLESASEGIVIIDELGHIRVVNASAERMFGYARADLIGAPIETLLPERLWGLHIGHRTEYLRAPRVRPMGQGLDLAAVRKEGSEFPVEISLSFVNTGGGQRVMAFITDITERKRGEDQLRRQREILHQTEKLAALGTLAAGLAHEINNPIGIISSRIELMLTETDSQGLPARAREDLEVLQRNVRRVGQIAHGLLSFARQSSRERSPVSLNRIVEETLLLAEPSLTRVGIRLRTALDPTLPSLVGDPDALQQVLVNLLANAREALGEAGTGEVSIATGPAPGRSGWIYLVVVDTGPGIPSDILGKLFDPFFTTKAHGTGLGLSVSYGIVEDHGGTIEVESEPGKGTTFRLTLPTGTAVPEDSPAD